MQESFREGGKVRTRTVEYLGVVEPGVARQVRDARGKLDKPDREALVASVRAAALAQVEAAEQASTVSETPNAAVRDATSPLITTKSKPETPTPPPEFLRWPENLDHFKVSHTAMHRTQERFAERLQAVGVDPSAMPTVTIEYDHPDGIRCRSVWSRKAQPESLVRPVLKRSKIGELRRLSFWLMV